MCFGLVAVLDCNCNTFRSPCLVLSRFVALSASLFVGVVNDEADLDPILFLPTMRHCDFFSFRLFFVQFWMIW